MVFSKNIDLGELIMLKVSRLETPFQEIVFLLTVILSLSIGVGGIFYLNLSTQSFISAAGLAGSSLIQWGFNGFGYTYFLFILFLLHIGHLTLATSHSFGELGRSFKRYLSASAINLAILLIVSSFFTVLEAYNGWKAGSHFVFGYGGWFGHHIGGFLFKSFGLYGALIILFSLISVIGISAGYMEIVHSFYVMKDIVQEIIKNIQKHGPQVIKTLKIRIIDFLVQRPYQARTARAHAGNSRSSHFDFHGIHKGITLHRGRMITDHFHLPRFTLSKQELTPAFEPKTPLSTQGILKDIPLQNPAVEQQPVEEPTVRTREKAPLPENSEKKEAPKKSKSSRVSRGSKKTETLPVEKEVINEDVTEETTPQKEEVVISSWTKRYKKVDVNLLEKPEKKKTLSATEIKKLCDLLKERLESFGIKGEVLKAHQGVTLTMFEFMPAAGMKLSKIQSLVDDLALVLGAKAIRVLTPIPGKTTVGIEVPNKEITTLRFSEIVDSCMKKKTMALPVPLGLDVYNKVHVNDLAKMPHLLVSGTTGSGKSVFMNNLISGLIFHKSPKQLRFLMIDPKMIELSPYNGIPHLLKPVITDVDEAKNLLLWAEKEMDKRYQMFADMQSKSITSFNQSVKKGSKRAVEGRLGRKIDWNFEEMPYIVIVIDELADLMLTHRAEVERPITRIAQKARAAGIHMVMATQRPSSDIVTGLIKTNFPTRVSFKVSSSIDSRTILGQPGAEKLLGHGDMLFMSQGKAVERLQGSFMTEEEVKKVVRSVASQGKTK